VTQKQNLGVCPALLNNPNISRKYEMLPPGRISPDLPNLSIALISTSLVASMNVGICLAQNGALAMAMSSFHLPVGGNAIAHASPSSPIRYGCHGNLICHGLLNPEASSQTDVMLASLVVSSPSLGTSGVPKVLSIPALG
jgi:hypothetical protein